MNPNVWSNTELSAIREQINAEILRRGTFRWWDPLCTPKIGHDRTPPMSLPKIGTRVPVDDQTYTINNPSEGSIEPTKNITYPLHGEFPAGEESLRMNSAPSTSAAMVSADELRNALVGLSKIQDINLFYGRDEIPNLAYRNPQGIEDVLRAAQADVRSVPLQEADGPKSASDPNGGVVDYKHGKWPVSGTTVPYPVEDGMYVMPSGERDGEEASASGLGPENFFDDHGASPGDADYHPYNPAISASPDRDWVEPDHTTKSIPVGGIPSEKYGKNPRNPVQGQSYPSRPVYGGVASSCHVACTGLCSLTCDSMCGESCTTTCWNRCGEACTSSCGNVCTGCTTLCYDTCKSKCENIAGYSCLKAGAKAVKITASGGKDGIPARNELVAEVHTCTGCSYTCQFYPNKKTSCWDAGCMGKCFNTCEYSCSTSCYGGCVDNAREDGSGYQSGHGRGCSGGCTLNCVGFCDGVCEGQCIQTCYHGCKQSCTDNCEWTCSANCGSGCEIECTNGCDQNCTSNTESKTSCNNGCMATCEHGCNKSCIAIGCRSVCGTGSATACEANCRLNCTATSCTAMCSDACSSECTTCVNTCGWGCGACSSMCATGCEAACNITCTKTCEHSCEYTCIHSCSEECGGCSNLCYSCVGMCIGECSVKCEANCTSCESQCSWWCDSSCSRECFVNCSTFCINSCSGNCSTYLMEHTTLPGPERDPTSEGYQYPHPSDRWEERESFRIVNDIAPYQKPETIPPLIRVVVNKHRNIEVFGDPVTNYLIYQTPINGGVYTMDYDGKVTVDVEMLKAAVETNRPNMDGGDAIFIVRIWTPGLILTPNDIKYTVPIGFHGYLYGYDDEWNAIVIIERDPFLYHPEYKEEEPDEDCWCKEYVEMTEAEFMVIWKGLHAEFPEESYTPLRGITYEEMRQIWTDDDTPVESIPISDPCDCGNLAEMDVPDVHHIWNKEGEETNGDHS